MYSDRKGSYASVKTEAPEESSEKEIDLDYVLVNEIGQFGRFQLFNTILAFVPIIVSCAMNEYIFSAAAIPHRCRIAECGETAKLVKTFEPKWLKNAIPGAGGSDLASCRRYVSLGNGSLDYCPADFFNKTLEVECDSFVYARNNSVVYDFDLGCQEWLRALAGTLSSVGTLLVLPITGYISDRWGRRMTLIMSVFNMALFGLIRAFSVNYSMYLALQLIQTTLGSGIFTASYIIATELIGPKWRVLVSATSSCMFAVGSVLLGAVAWAANDWRMLLMIFNIPSFVIIAYYWVMSESVRWLLVKGRFKEAKSILEKVAKVNNKQISEQSMAALMTPASTHKKCSVTTRQEPMIKTIWKSRILLRRVCTTPIWWVTTAFVYYGLSINATSLSDQMHLNYILIAAIEIPGHYSSLLLLDRIGRRLTLCGGFALSAASNIIYTTVSAEYTLLRLLLFLLGKFSISLVFTSVYLYTSELYPTEYRHNLLAFSSMVGRFGSICAPLTPVLLQYWSGFPAMLFGTMALISGVLVLTQPETLGTKMPDTLAEAEALGTKKPLVA